MPRRYYDFQAPEGLALTDDQIAMLEASPFARVSQRARMTISHEWEYGRRGRGEADPGPLGDAAVRRLLTGPFDACLEWESDGARSVWFRVPAARLRLAAVKPYLATHGALSAQVKGEHLILCLSHYEVDGELGPGADARPGPWLAPMLPLRADLAAGDLSALYIGWLKSAQKSKDRDSLELPPRPRALQELPELTPQLRKLAGFLRLGPWARSRLPRVGAGR